MSKKQITIAFKNIHQLWDFARQINAANIEIIMAGTILICECNDNDLEHLPEFGGRVIEEFIPMKNSNAHK